MADKESRKTLVISFEGHKESTAPAQDNRADNGIQFRKIPMADMIRTYRRKAKISQQDLGEMLGVTRNTVVNWEGGKYRPDIDLLLPLCEVFGITLYELFGTEDQSQGVSAHERGLLDQYRQISPLSQRIVDRMVDSILYEETEDRKFIPQLSFAVPVSYETDRFLNDVNRKADAVLPIKGDSMLPKYHSGDMVYVQFTQSPDVGEDVICRSKEGFHIKRLGEEGPYSLNPDVPFTLTSPDDHVETIGRVLGIVDASADFPSAEEGDLLRELCHEDIEEFREEYHLTES